MLPLAEFVAAYDGKSVGCGANGGPGDFPTGQCTALACLWTVNLGLGQPCGYCSGLSRCDAICWAGVAAPGWTWIANALGNFPSPGDLVVFGAGCGYDVPAGHIAVVMPGANTSSIPVFEQNFNGPYCATNTHSYACCLGWQHPGVTLPGSSSSSAVPPPVSSSSSSVPIPTPCPPGYQQIGGYCYPPAAPESNALPALLAIAGLGLLGFYAYEHVPSVRHDVDRLRSRL